MGTVRSALEALLLTRLAQAGLPAPEPGYRFATALGRRWEFDAAYVAAKVAIEVEGAIWVQGRHTRGLGFELDCEKYAQALMLGWKVLRVTRKMIEDGRAVRYVAALLEGA